MLRHIFVLSVALVGFSISSAAHADEDDKPFTTWQNTTPSNVNQSALITSSNGGVEIDIGIVGQNEGASGSPGLPGGVINENPRGPRGGGGPGFSLPPLLPPTGGANIIVPGGPMSFETQLPNGPTRGFGGVSVGGWTFDTPGTAGVTPRLRRSVPVRKSTPGPWPCGPRRTFLY